MHNFTKTTSSGSVNKVGGGGVGAEKSGLRSSASPPRAKRGIFFGTKLFKRARNSSHGVFANQYRW